MKADFAERTEPGDDPPPDLEPRRLLAFLLLTAVAIALLLLFRP